MPDIFADDLFEIHGVQIPISIIVDYRLQEFEYIMRPVYFERSIKKWGGFLKKAEDHKIEFEKMEYYAAIIGEKRFKNAIEDVKAFNLFEAVAKTAVEGINDAVGVIMRKPSGQRIRYRIVTNSGRVIERSLLEIPATLHRADGKQSEVFPNDELYPLLGEPIAPAIVPAPGLIIKTKEGEYAFFGNGIHVQDIEQEYERLKLAVKVVKEIKKRKDIEKKGNLGLLEGIRKQIPNLQQVSLPVISLEKKKLDEVIIESKEKEDSI